MNRGSEWRRWDLHLHTPYTKKEDRFRGKTEAEKWDLFYASIAEYIGDGSDPSRAICAIGITDYLSIDNYIKVRDDGRLPDCIKLILPNVELRVIPVASDSPINIHCIFDPSIVPQLESRFFGNLKFQFDGNYYSATKAELIRLGRDFARDSLLSEERALLTGINQYVITMNALTDVFKNNPGLREKTIIVVSNSSSDGASITRTHSDYFVGDISQLEATRRAIYQFSDMIFSSKDSDISYFLGKKKDPPQTVIEKCGSLMPCIHGCDAHTNEDIFVPKKDRFCWIKADPTFEGLKQVIYEPEERVYIGSNIPDRKPEYYVIDRVIIDGNELFSGEPIFFSEELTCIIGGKSTGKSLLLHNIASAIDPLQVDEKSSISGSKVRSIQGIKVYWRDGGCSPSENAKRKIVYIPQTYLNRLSDDEQRTTELDVIIQSIILQDEECKQAYDRMQARISSQKQELAKKIVDLLEIVRQRKELIGKIEELGNLESITAEISQLKSQLEKLSNEYDVTSEELSAFDTSSGAVRLLSTQLSAANSDIASIQSLHSVLDIKVIDGANISFFGESFLQVVQEITDIANQAWEQKKASLLQSWGQQRDSISKSISENQDIVNRLRPKMEGNNRIKKVSELLVESQKRLETLSGYESELNKLQSRYKDALRNIIQAFLSFPKIYDEYIAIANSRICSSEEDELDFSVRRVFRSKPLESYISNTFDNRSLSRFTEYDLRSISEDTLSFDNISSFVEAVISESKNSIQLKRGNSVNSALSAFLDNWYNLNYVVKMDNDKLEDMSPGKKALVLLRLLISLDESTCPILIDQPEDDLDNRSIFNELINFIKKSKNKRQIIVVTHNANIVLGADAELVIVANQRGKNSPNKRYQFEYRGGSIENNSPIIPQKAEETGILYSKGIQAHICEILEGGERAFVLRQKKYHFVK